MVRLEKRGTTDPGRRALPPPTVTSWMGILYRDTVFLLYLVSQAFPMWTHFHSFNFVVWDLRVPIRQPTESRDGFDGGRLPLCVRTPATLDSFPRSPMLQIS